MTGNIAGSGGGFVGRYFVMFDLAFLAVVSLGGVIAGSPIATQSGRWSDDVLRSLLPLLVYGACLGVMLRSDVIRRQLNRNLKAKV